jgi:para-nitrobenzyl esterase
MNAIERPVAAGATFLACCLIALVSIVGLPAPAIAQAAGTAGQDSTVVMTDLGAVRGVVHDGVREFKGIPYAAAPVGDLRWSMPQSPKAWTGTLDATKYGSACPQAARYGLTEASDDENCLSINVTVPVAAGQKAPRKRPVIVWIHGGAFVGGASSLYPLDYMAKSGGVIVVSLNYRLGVFGFMAHSSFDADHNGGYGLEDQRLALHWVKRNIGAFGGDAGNVTVAGESAGAASVCMHILAPDETSGLFQKAIIQSAGCATPLPTVADASKTGAKVAALVGCGDPATALACLKKKPVKDLLAAAAEAAGANLMAYAPATGAKTVPLPGGEALRAGRFVKVPVINGGNRDELRLYVAYAIQAGDTVTSANYRDHLNAVYGKNTDTVLKQYPASAYSSAPTALGSVMSDFRSDVGLNNCIYIETGKLMAKSVPVYEYVFGDANAPPVTPDPGFEMGAVHSAELPYQFPHFSNTTKLDGPDLAAPSQKLATQMIAYWTSFARVGKPSAPGSPTWGKFLSNRDAMRFEPGRVGYFDAAAAHRCAFWKKLYPGILTQ